MRTLFILLMLLPGVLWAQESHSHSHARNEVGISPGAVYSPSHEAWGFGLHAHYFRTLGAHSPWAVGGSLEGVWSHDNHYTVGAGVKYTMFDKLSLAVMPGITFFSSDDHAHELFSDGDDEHAHGNRPRFSLHVELVYDLIHWKQFHLGPAVDYSWSKHDSHFMFGIHCAYGF